MKKELKKYALGLGAGNEIVSWIEKRVYENSNISEAEHIIDYLLSDKAPKRFERATYDQMKSNSEKWNKTLIKKGSKIKECESILEIVLDFEDGFKFVKLVGFNK